VQFPPHGSSATLVFFKYRTKFHTQGSQRGTPLRGLQMKLGWVETAINPDFLTIIRYISETIEDRHIVTMED